MGQNGALYFVTFHLADSIPAEVRARIERTRDAWLARHPEPWSAETEQEYRELYLGEVERALDEGRGLCPLRAAACGGVVAEALRHFDGDRVDVMAFVVMPNHVHAAVIPRGEWSLEKLVHSWKRWSAVRVNRLTAKSGELWQADYFDTIVRDRADRRRCQRFSEKLAPAWHAIRARATEPAPIHCPKSSRTIGLRPPVDTPNEPLRVTQGKAGPGKRGKRGMQ